MGWMHSCKQVAELLTRSLDEPLGFVERLRLRLHLHICGDCANVEQQLATLRAQGRDLFAEGLGDEAPPRA
jgi:hypothetical protein